jgi:hypothetical protein
MIENAMRTCPSGILELSESVAGVCIWQEFLAEVAALRKFVRLLKKAESLDEEREKLK